MSKEKEWDKNIRSMERHFHKAKEGEKILGPFRNLPGTWGNNDNAFGFNMICLPFVDKRTGEPGKKSRGYRVLSNKYVERLTFTDVDPSVPNRGVEPKDEHDHESGDIEGCYERDGDSKNPGEFKQTDQFALALDYQQVINQIEAIEFPKPDESDEDQHKPESGKICKTIHHEPGLFMRMTSPVAHTIQRKPSIRNVPLNIARLATIPHGDSVLALGSCEILDYPKKSVEKIINAPSDGSAKNSDQEAMSYLAIPDYTKVKPTDTNGKFEMGMPKGTSQSGDYIKPYDETKLGSGDDVFDPKIPQKKLLDDLKTVLNFGGENGFNGVDNVKDFPIKRSTRFWFDTEIETGGILNIPFVTKQANASAMRSTFWIHEVVIDGEETMIMQYLQTVLLDFHFIRSDDAPGRIRWPHVSINTMFKDPQGDFDCCDFYPDQPGLDCKKGDCEGDDD